MLPDLKEKLKAYADAFDAEDDELYSELIPNSGAFSYLANQIPPAISCSRDFSASPYGTDG